MFFLDLSDWLKSKLKKDRWTVLSIIFRYSYINAFTFSLNTLSKPELKNNKPFQNQLNERVIWYKAM